jgi:predicted PurR-regulated permease PerM
MSKPDTSESAATPEFLNRKPSTGEYLHIAKLTALVSGLVLAIYLAYRTVSFAPDVFMIGFLGILFAVFLASLSRLLGKLTGIAYRWNLAIVSLVLFVSLTAFLIFFGSVIYEQVQKGVQQFEAGGARIIALADEYPPLRSVVDSVPFLNSFRDDSKSGENQPNGQNEHQQSRSQSNNPNPGGGTGVGVGAGTGRALPADSITTLNGEGDETGASGTRSGTGNTNTNTSGRTGEQSGQAQSEQGQAEQNQSEQPENNQSQDEQPENEQPANEQPANEQPANEQPENDQPENDQPENDQNGQTNDASQMAMTVTREVGALAGRFFVTTFGLLTNFVLIVIVGLYLAASPHAYQRAPSYLFPPRVRPEVYRILTISGETLWRWLLGRMFSMSVSGFGTAIFLYFFDVPSAFLIGALTFLLGFIPNLGPLLAMAVAMFFVIPQGLTTVAIVVGVLSFFELLESYLVAPLVTEHQVSLPPALVIFFQALMGITLGFIGLTVAAPLLAVVGVLFKEVYRKKLLKEYDADDNPVLAAHSSPA